MTPQELRAVSKTCKAQAVARRRAEAERWKRLSDDEKWAEMAAAARRWGRLRNPQQVGAVLETFLDVLSEELGISMPASKCGEHP